jgi:nitrite reductase/ring-hydroxylating ferredoxin subunit/DMSO/TMAO reductase YedYZ heme-binding membrane subunit
MSVGYRTVQWSGHKRVYDLCVIGGIAAFIATYTGTALLARGDAPGPEVLAIQALGACAIVLLHVILCIGPLARLDARFLPILYNRRHLGVLTFLVALSHGVLAVGYYHGFGVLNPLVSLLTINTNYASIVAFPFQTLGLLGLIIMFLLAATSHDFWLNNLSAVVWKRLHMSVYVAYVLLVGHVALGAMQADSGVLIPALLGAGVLVVSGLHIAAGRREARRDLPAQASAEGWIDAGPASEIPMDRARIVCAAGAASHGAERIAVFRHEGGISAVSNVCAHQGGPLGEGKVIDGCVTCPWHGWQYRVVDGVSPPPFVEKVPVYQVRIVQGRVQVNARPLPLGTMTEPARPEHDAHAAERAMEVRDERA